MKSTTVGAVLKRLSAAVALRPNDEMLELAHRSLTAAANAHAAEFKRARRAEASNAELRTRLASLQAELVQARADAKAALAVAGRSPRVIRQEVERDSALEIRAVKNIFDGDDAPARAAIGFS